MNSLRTALLARILTGLMVVLAVAGLVVFSVARSSLRAQHDRALVARARMFAALVMEEGLDPRDQADRPGLVLEYAGPLGETDLGVLVRITADDGSVIAQSPGWPAAAEGGATGPGRGEPVLSGIELEPGARARVVEVRALAERDPEDLAHATAPPPPPRAVTVQVIGRDAPVERAEAALIVALLLGGLLAAAGTSTAVWLGIRRGLVPIRRLGSALDGLGPHHLAMPPGAQPYPEELRPITAAVDGLLARLRAAIERERRFTDAAAHELRTPIAELRTTTDVADRWPEPDRLRRTVAEARSIASEMESLLESLLTVARGQQPGAEQPREPVALLPLARSLAGGTPEGTRPRVSWTFEGDDNARWTGPRGAILAIVRNLIQNAAEYTPDGGSVRVSAHANGAGTIFEIESGPVALAADDADRIFEPFWRADESRSDRGHRGLGLPIVASLADALRLRRDAMITPDRRLRVTLSS